MGLRYLHEIVTTRHESRAMRHVKPPTDMQYRLIYAGLLPPLLRPTSGALRSLDRELTTAA